MTFCKPASLGIQAEVRASFSAPSPSLCLQGCESLQHGRVFPAGYAANYPEWLAIRQTLSSETVCCFREPSFTLARYLSCHYMVLIMLIRKANTYRLYPTPEQEAVLGQWSGAVRFVYNLGLEQRRDFHHPDHKWNFASQCREITMLRNEVDWLRDVPVHALQSAVRALDGAHKRYFDNLPELRAEEARRKAAGTWKPRKDGKPLGYPSPRRKFLDDTMRFPDPATFDFRRLSKHWGEVKLPKLGWVRFRWDRAIPGTTKNITVSRRAGIWSVAAQYEQEITAPIPRDLPSVGIDRGVAVFAALSDGTNVASVNHGKKALKALARAQRKLARKKKVRGKPSGTNRRKQVLRVARLHARVARARKDFLHKQSTTIAQNHGDVVLERLEIRNMVRSAKGTAEKPGSKVRQKAGLNRSILDQGWGMFRVMLGWKVAERGGKVIEVAAHYTSQTCAECGVVDAASRANQSRFRCTHCGHQANADTNAAIVIKRRADSPLLPVKGKRARRPDEAGRIRRAA
jgi:putative transposase